MLDFEDFLEGEDNVEYDNLFNVFESLDRHGSHTELRTAQKDAVSSINSLVDEKDIVLKLSTGSGKTTVGLLYLWAQMKRKGGPGLYLCPNNQLVDQVVDEAKRLGISAFSYRQGEPHPHTNCIRGEAVTVCTYDKLLNGRSTFRRDDVSFVPCALVADDAHAGVDVARRKFTLNLTGKNRDKLVSILDAPCEKYRRTLWAEIKSGDPKKYLEVPFWIWEDSIGQISDLLVSIAESKDVLYEWPNVSELLEVSRCVVSGNNVEITPIIPDVTMHPAISDAQHRLFMSATLAEDSVLVRELGVSPAAALNPVYPESDKGLGERMVLAPSLISKELDRAAVIEVCKELSSNYNVVVLCPNNLQATQWVNAGARLYKPDEFGGGVKDLKSNTSGVKFAVFAQRYDGVDLADEACRVLVVDGMPYGESTLDQVEATYLSHSSISKQRLVNRIEQGMGRAVRSHVDYSAVLLVGVEISSFIAKKEVIDSMGDHTKRQLNMALDLSGRLSNSSGNATPEYKLKSTILQCLQRDEGWKKYYKKQVKDQETVKPEPDKKLVDWAKRYRDAFYKSKSKDFRQAFEMLNSGLSSDLFGEKENAFYMQIMAQYAYSFDPAKAHEIQQAAYSKNNCLIRPVSIPRAKIVKGKYTSAEVLRDWYVSFDIPNGASAEVRRVETALNYEADYEAVESALLDLAQLLGAIGSRPEQEYNEGPDVLWEWDNMALVIEAKNENVKTLHKKDAGQLLVSCQWYERRCQDSRDIIPVVAAKTSTPDRYTDYPDNTRVINKECLSNIFSSLSALVDELVVQGPIFASVSNIDRLLKERKLVGRDFVRHYTVPLKKK